MAIVVDELIDVTTDKTDYSQLPEQKSGIVRVTDSLDYTARLTLTKKGYLTITFSLVFLGLFISTGIGFFAILFSVILVSLIINYQLFSRQPINDLEIERFVERLTMFQGDFSLVTLKVKNKNYQQKLGILKVVEMYQPDLEIIRLTDKLVKYFVLGPQEEDTFSYLFRSKRMGKFVLGPVRLVLNDFLGIFSLDLVASIYTEVIIYPRAETGTTMFELAKKRRLGRFFDLFRVKEIGTGMDFYGIRDYQRYDDYRLIAWKQSIRLRKLLVKVYENYSPMNIMVCLDIGDTMLNAVDEGVRKFDLMINAAIMFLLLGLETRDFVGFMLFSDNVKKFIYPRNNQRQFWESLKSMATVPLGNKTDFVQMAKYFSAMIRQKTLLIIISDLTSDPENVMEAMKILKLRNHDIFMVYLPEKDFIDKRSTMYRKSRLGSLYDDLYYSDKRKNLLFPLVTKGIRIFPIDRTVITEKKLPVELERYSQIQLAQRR